MLACLAACPVTYSLSPTLPTCRTAKQKHNVQMSGTTLHTYQTVSRSASQPTLTYSIHSFVLSVHSSSCQMDRLPVDLFPTSVRPFIRPYVRHSLTAGTAHYFTHNRSVARTVVVIAAERQKDDRRCQHYSHYHYHYQRHSHVAAAQWSDDEWEQPSGGTCRCRHRVYH